MSSIKFFFITLQPYAKVVLAVLRVGTSLLRAALKIRQRLLDHDHVVLARSLHAGVVFGRGHVLFVIFQYHYF